MRAQCCRRGPGRAGILGLAPRHTPNGFGGCPPTVSRPRSALLPLPRLPADHSPCIAPVLGAARSDPGAAATARPRALPQPRRRPRSISRSLRAGGLQREGPEEPAYAWTDIAATLWEAGEGGPERRPPNVRRDPASCGYLRV